MSYRDDAMALFASEPICGRCGSIPMGGLCLCDTTQERKAVAEAKPTPKDEGCWECGAPKYKNDARFCLRCAVARRF